MIFGVQSPIFIIMKICCNCKVELPLTEFYYENGKPKGKCKNCRKICNKINFEKWSKTDNGKLRLKENKKKYEQKIKDKSKIVREEKRKQKDILLKEKQQRKELREIRKKENEQKSLEYKKLMDYYKSPEGIEEKRKTKRKNEYKKWKRKWVNDELFAVKVRLRNLIRNSFRKQGYKKFDKNTESIVGISYEEFKSYINSKFLDGMTWENRGDWHIDHIIPISSANSEEEMIKLSHYTNLQPLWAEENISKGNKIL